MILPLFEHEKAKRAAMTCVRAAVLLHVPNQLRLCSIADRTEFAEESFARVNVLVCLESLLGRERFVAR